MKRRIFTLLLSLLCAVSFGSCAPKEEAAQDSSAAEAGTEESSSGESSDTEASDGESGSGDSSAPTSPAISIDQLNEIAAEVMGEDFGEPISFGAIDPHVNYYAFSDFELFCSTGIMGCNTILAHRFADDSWHDVDLGRFSCQNITGISTDPDNPKLLTISVDGFGFGGDFALNDFARTLRFDENFSNMEVISYGGSENIWDADLFDIHSTEHIVIKDIAFGEKSATFSFDLAGEPVGNGYPFPHITIRKEFDRDKSADEHLFYIYNLYFHNLQNEFSQDWLTGLAAALNWEEGETVSVSYYDDPDTFQGALLKISRYYEPGLKFEVGLPEGTASSEVTFTIYTE